MSAIEEDDLLTFADLEGAVTPEYAYVNAWGKRARIKSLTSEDMIEFRESNEGEAKKTAGLRLIIKSLVDRDGKCILSLKNLEMLKQRSEKENGKVVEAIIKLNGMSVKQDEKAKND